MPAFVQPTGSEGARLTLSNVAVHGSPALWLVTASPAR